MTTMRLPRRRQRPLSSSCCGAGERNCGNCWCRARVNALSTARALPSPSAARRAACPAMRTKPARQRQFAVGRRLGGHFQLQRIAGRASQGRTERRAHARYRDHRAEGAADKGQGRLGNGLQGAAQGLGHLGDARSHLLDALPHALEDIAEKLLEFLLAGHFQQFPWPAAIPPLRRRRPAPCPCRASPGRIPALQTRRRPVAGIARMRTRVGA